MDTPFSNLLSKQGRMVITLGHDLMEREVGERIPTVQEYSERYKASIGTTQSAQSFLHQHGMVKLESRGHQGTYLTEIRRHDLWHLIHPGSIVGAMPLPYSTRYEGLATALSERFHEAEIALNLVYIRGAKTRLRTLSEGRSDFTVMSAFAVEQAQKDNQKISTFLNLGSETYVSEHVLVFREPEHLEIEDGMRVGIDPQSLDQAYFTQHACAGKQVEMVEVGYMQLPTALQKNLIDATVWNRDELQRYADLYVAPSKQIEAYKTNTEACIVTSSSATGLMILMKEFLHVDEIRKIQQDVIDGTQMPRY